MVTYKRINFSTGSIEEVDLAITDVTYGPAAYEQFASKRWDDIVNAFDDGSGYTTFEEKETAILGLIGLTSKLDNMTLEQLKVFWNKRIKKQYREALDEAIDDVDIVKALEAVIGVSSINKAANKYVSIIALTNAYKAAKATALDAITAATTKEEVIAVEFVTPA